VRRTPGVQQRRALLVLAFHNVEATWCWPSDAGEGISTFVRQMKTLHGIANVVPLEDALRALEEGRPLPPRAVALTFDDGYRDNLTLAVPVLQRFAMPATIYLVPGFLSGQEQAWWERLGWAVGCARSSHLQFGGRSHPLTDANARVAAIRAVETAVKSVTHAERCRLIEQVVEDLRPSGEFGAEDLFLDWESARKLVDGGMSIGSHTLGHAILAREDAADQRADLSTSRRLLQEGLGVEVNTLAYPNGRRGDYDATTIAAARDAGYSHAVTTWGRPVSAGADPYEICRLVVSTSMRTPVFAAKVLQQFLPSREAVGAGSAAREPVG
jgi:peptidoglycan/xylan/chitin deacetylase (PgdA/CDA1 family)